MQFLSILAAGLARQWIAWRFSLPAIVVLISVGLLLAPGTGLIELAVPHEIRSTTQCFP